MENSTVRELSLGRKVTLTQVGYGEESTHFFHVLMFIKSNYSSYKKAKHLNIYKEGNAIQANFFTGLRKGVEPWLILTIAG